MRATRTDGQRVTRLAVMKRGLQLATLAFGFTACGSEEPRPGVVLVVVDTLRGDVSTDPKGYFTTPNLDAFTEESIRFSKAFSHAPMTLPAHTSLFAGRPPFETGVLVNHQKLDPELPLLADWMAEFGYSTHAVISLGTLYHHVSKAAASGERGIARGFDSYDEEFWHIQQAPDVMSRLLPTLDEIDPAGAFFLFAHFCDPHEPYNAHGAADRQAELLLDGEPFETVSLSDMTLEIRDVELLAGPHVLEARSEDKLRFRGFQVWRDGKRLDLDWEEGRIAEPTQSVRITFEAPEDGTYTFRYWLNDALKRKESVSRYLAEVEYTDRHLGTLFDELRARDLYDDHWVILTSDHGEALGERNFLGHVQNLHDELIHVPLVIKPPKGAPQRATLEAERDRLVTHADLTATVLELVGLPPLPGQRGSSLLGPRRPFLIAETHQPEARSNQICFRDDRFKLIYNADADTFEMYDLQADPGEEENVFESMQGERPEWPERLRDIARVTAGGGTRGGEDPEMLEALKALGYGGE